jgi:hypothetical protein
MHKGHYGHPGPADNHSPERGLGDVWSIPKPLGNTHKGSFGTHHFISFGRNEMK